MKIPSSVNFSLCSTLPAVSVLVAEMRGFPLPRLLEDNSGPLSLLLPEPAVLREELGGERRQEGGRGPVIMQPGKVLFITLMPGRRKGGG